MGMIFVYGGGFGLYGHAAALVGMGVAVSTLERYRLNALQRAELMSLVPKIRWVGDTAEAIQTASAIVFARRPQDNEADGRRLLADNKGGLLIFEKPMAQNWRRTQALEADLMAHQRNWAIPFLFLYCDWFEGLEERLRRGESQQVTWLHRQAPKVHSWKNSPGEGGGIGAFYFLHFLAVFEALMPNEEISYRYDVNPRQTRLCATASASRALLKIDFRLGKEAGFEIGLGPHVWHRSATPFGPMFETGRTDPRNSVLQKFYRREVLRQEGAALGSGFYRRVTLRWKELEENVGEI